MRMILFVSLPVERFNAAVKDGSAPLKMKKILDATKPEAAYFTDLHGKRTGILILDLKDNSQIPAMVEPWMLTFDASIEVHPVMVTQDLMASGLDKIAKAWA